MLLDKNSRQSKHTGSTAEGNTFSDEGLTLGTSAFNLFTVANLPYQLS